MIQSCLLTHSDSLCLLIHLFRLLRFKLIFNIGGLISIIFVTVFYLLPLFLFLSSLFMPFVDLTEHLISLHFLSLSITVLFFFFTLFSGSPRVCKIHLKLIQVYF